jgi:pyruvate dehydrogenase E1 component
MYDEEQDVFYYITLYNENYLMPERPKHVEDEGILKGLYRYKEAAEGGKHRVQLLGSGSILGEVLRAQDLLAENHEVAADVWSAPSYQQLRFDALEVERWNRLHPAEARKQPYVTRCLEPHDGPVIAASDSMKVVADQIARWVPAPFVPLGTDGFGRSDDRAQLRRHFEVDAESIVVATLAALAEFGDVKPEVVAEAIERYGLDPERASSAAFDL